MPHRSAVPVPEARGVYRVKHPPRGWLVCYAVNAAGDTVLRHEELLTADVDPEAVVVDLERRLDVLDPATPGASLVRLK